MQSVSFSNQADVLVQHQWLTQVPCRSLDPDWTRQGRHPETQLGNNSCWLQVALDHGYNFDEDELNAMMEVAASVTERASTTNMTFQAFQKLVEHYSTIT